MSDCEECGQHISKKVMDFSKQKFKKALCFKCQKKEDPIEQNKQYGLRRRNEILLGQSINIIQGRVGKVDLVNEVEVKKFKSKVKALYKVLVEIYDEVFEDKK